MKKLALIPVLVGLAAVYAAAQTPAPTAAPGAKATLSESTAGVIVKLDLQGVPPGTHAFHIHAVGKCDPPDFMTAGGHFNPTMAKHGLLASGGPHAGDMPNVTVGADGRLTAEVLDTSVRLTSGANGLFDADGSALVLH